MKNTLKLAHLRQAENSYMKNLRYLSKTYVK